MITSYLIVYLSFLILVSLAVSLLIMRIGQPSPWLFAGLIILLIVLPLWAGYYYISYIDSLPETVVPDVRGMGFESAREKLEAAQLKARLAGSIYETKYPEGAVASQRPESGRNVKVGRVVNLMLSSGKRKVAAPNLLGRPFSQVEAVLAANELALGQVKKEKNTDAPEGTILAQEPLPGEQTEAGGSVDLLVATAADEPAETTTTTVQERSKLNLWLR